jgi:hypothetical protein
MCLLIINVIIYFSIFYLILNILLDKITFINKYINHNIKSILFSLLLED